MYRFARVLSGFLGLAALAFILAAGGCGAGNPRAISAAGLPSTMLVNAKWSDVEPALEVAVRRVEMAIVDREIGPDLLRFELLTAGAEPGWLTARPSPLTPPTLRSTPSGTPSAADEGEVPITLETRVGLFGDVVRERQLLSALERRLSQLRGREWAPVR